MKGFTKFCLILSGILVVLGLGGIGVSLAMGLTPSQLLDLAHFPGRFHTDMDSFIDDIGDISPLSGKNTNWGQEYYEFYDLSGLDFNLALCELDIKSHDKDYIILEAENAKDTFHCSTDSDVLVLEDDRSAPVTGRSMDNALRLKLYLPQKQMKDVNIIVGVGDVDIDRIDSESFILENGVGNLKIKSLETEQLSLSLGVADCRIESLSASKKCSIDAATCDLTLEYFEGPHLDLDCAAGDVSVTAKGRAKDYNYTLGCGAGDIHLNFPNPDGSHSHGEHNGLGDHMDVNHHAEQTLNIDCALGDLELNFTEED